MQSLYGHPVFLHIPEDKRASARNVLHVNPPSQHEPSSRDDNSLVSMNPARRCRGPTGLLDAFGLFTYRKAYARPTRKLTIFLFHWLNKAKHGVGGIAACTKRILVAIEVQPFDIRASTSGNELFAFCRPEGLVRLRFNLERLKCIRFHNLGFIWGYQSGALTRISTCSQCESRSAHVCRRLSSPNELGSG